MLAKLSEDNLELDFTAVFRASLSDDDDDVREKATRGLFDCDDRVVIRPLNDLLAKDPSPKVKAAAAVSLGKFAEMAQDGKLLERDADRIREALLEAIGREGQDDEVRRKAIEAVASFNSEEVQRIIRDAYENGDATLKQTAIYAMGRSSDSQYLPTVLDETHHDDPAIRYEAALAAGQLGDESTVPYLIRLIKDDDFQVQLSAVQALGEIGGPLAKRALLQCLKMGEDALEDAAQAALANLEFDDDPLGFRFQA
ncbi:MAG: HEAT repeat domain-containing protein [Chloroflexi bacterium]|nr:HEAT repeat domain-containing protein [Chloroflexota bacterium]